MSLLSGKRVLVVEDEPIVAMTLEDFLGEMGCDVLDPVSTVAAARTAVRDWDFDVAILDVNLNGERSDEIAEMLEQLGRPYMFATGYGPAGVREGDGAVVIQKPYQFQQLRTALELLLSGEGRAA